MNQLQSLIDTVIASSIDRAARGAGKGDLAHGLLAGLRRIRGVVGLQAGYGAACAIGDSIHDLILERALEAFGAKPVALPPPGPGAARAATILEDAAMTCLTLNAYFPGNTALTVATRVMTQRLLDTVGGAPDWLAVSAVLHAHEAEDEETAGEGGWASLAVH